MPEPRSDLLKSNNEDVDWVACAQAGDVRAFDSLVLKHSGKLYALIFQMTANHEDTNDLLQDVWTKSTVPWLGSAVRRSLPHGFILSR